MSAGFFLRSSTRRFFKNLDLLAATGDYNIARLHDLKESPEIGRSKESIYYLASLYLQLGENAVAHELLSGRASASSAMKRYYHVLSYSRCHNLPTPKLTIDEENCITYLDSAVNPVQNLFESIVVEAGGFSVVGNAPGPLFQHPHDGVRIYFNSYKSNTRITDSAAIHVVTPSWNIKESNSAAALCITGNNIFYRRSRVWQKFINNKNFTSIYTVPSQLWNSLYRELGTSPSAGLLLLSWLETITARYPKTLKGVVAGFSNNVPSVNHDYDSEPASKRHNWEIESVIRDRMIRSLKRNCLSLTVEA